MLVEVGGVVGWCLQLANLTARCVSSMFVLWHPAETPEGIKPNSYEIFLDLLLTRQPSPGSNTMQVERLIGIS